jgi:exosortase
MNATTSKAPLTATEHGAARLQFAALFAASAIFGWKTLAALIQYSLSHEDSSHVVVIPFLSAYVIWSERDRIFGAYNKPAFRGLGLAVIALGTLAYGAAWFWTDRTPGTNGFSLQVLCLVAIWIGIFVSISGARAARAALFPLLLLLLMIPLPDAILSRVVYALEKGSTDITYAIFQILRVPTLRSGFYLTVPGITIEVAPECSGIRSSVAMLITCLLAAHYYLRTWWGTLLFMFLVVPVAMIKNGIRIATLTLLSLYVDPSFLRGSLHRDGGFVFFFIGLAILGLALVGIRKLERRISAGAPPSGGALRPEFGSK